MQSDKKTKELGLYTCETVKIEDEDSFHTEDRCSIRIVKCLPADILRDVLAHEIAHHWLHHHISVSRTEFQEEGFAEWVAFCISRQAGYDRAVLGHTQNDDPIYGDGFRSIWTKQESGKHPAIASLFQEPPKTIQQSRISIPAQKRCPKCNGPMELQTSPQNGRKFWGCIRYPECKGFEWVKK